MEYRIRKAVDSDAQAVHDIYGEYVGDLDVTFTVNNPSVEHYREKIAQSKYPFYVAEGSDGTILGYCCGSPLRPHDAYRWNVASTIILSKSAPKRQGIGTALYHAFIDDLKALNYQYVYAVIVDINETSIAMHSALGFKEVGRFHNAGYKQGHWLGIVWMALPIGNPASVKEPITPAEQA